MYGNVDFLWVAENGARVIKNYSWEIEKVWTKEVVGLNKGRTIARNSAEIEWMLTDWIWVKKE